MSNTIEVLSQPAGRVKHNAKTWDYSHDIDDVDISYIDTFEKSSSSDGDADLVREARQVDVAIYVPAGSRLTAADRVSLPDDPAVYSIVGKPLRRRNDRTGTVFKTKVLLVQIEG